MNNSGGEMAVTTMRARVPPNVTDEHCWMLRTIEIRQNGAYAKSSLGVMILPLETMFAVVIFFGLVGNLLVILAVIKYNRLKHLRNFFIVNLAASDLLLCVVTAPVTLYLTLNLFWPFGNTGCQVVATLQALNTFVSSLTLAAIAFDRYQVVLFPTHLRSQYIVVIMMLCVVWALSLTLAAPYFFAVSTTDAFFRPWNTTVIVHFLKQCDIPMPQLCVEEYWQRLPFTQKQYTLTTFAVQYFTPLFSLIIVYYHIGHKMSGRLKTGAAAHVRSEERRRTALARNRKSMLLLTGLVTVFAVCWLPVNFYTTLNVLGAIRFSQATYIYFNLIGTLVAVFNPIMYGLLNENFRIAFKDMLQPVIRCILAVISCFRRPASGNAVRSTVLTNDYQRNNLSVIALRRRNSRQFVDDDDDVAVAETVALQASFDGDCVVMNYASLNKMSPMLTSTQHTDEMPDGSTPSPCNGHNNPLLLTDATSATAAAETPDGDDSVPMRTFLAENRFATEISIGIDNKFLTTNEWHL